jgi:hypothetical protein
LVIGSNPIRPKKTLDKNSNSVKLKTMKQTYDIIKDSHLVAPTYHWMLNGYAKHTELTQEDFKAYFKAREQKRKDKLNATR